VSAYSGFLKAHPDYEGTAAIDALRGSEYPRLDADGHVYLDYTGAGLFAESQVRDHAQLLTSGIFGNPHSASPASSRTTALVEQARRAVLDWFNAQGDYTAIFTQNATAAIKLVGESYPFAAGGRLLLTADNHNSVNGIREFARARGAEVTYAPLTMPELRADRKALADLLGEPRAGQRVFAYPAQSNFSGVQHPLDLVHEAQAAGWDVLLDAAAFVPSNRLDLQAVRPDFVSVSFYKMFGYPTGVGCLLVRKTSLARLERPWFAGGTVNFATVQGRRYLLSPGEAGFEDGTLNYLAIPAVEIGLRHLAAVGLDLTAFQDLTTARMSEFNAAVPDRRGVAYASVVGVAPGLRELNPLLVPTWLWLSERAGESDGVVPASSQRWGEVVRTIAADHWAQIGWSKAFDAVEFYVELLRELRGRGF